MENHPIIYTTAWLLLSLFAVAKESIAAGGLAYQPSFEQRNTHDYH
jgi:hypothetical protein